MANLQGVSGLSQAADLDTVNNKPLQQPAPARGIGDAAEEITFAFSEKIEEIEKEADGAKRNDIVSTGMLRTMPVEVVEKLYEKMSGPDDVDRLRATIQLLLQNIASGTDPRQALELTAQDATRQFLLLRLALREAKRRGKTALIDTLESAVEDFEADSANEIHAGINTADIAAAYGQSAAKKDAFRKHYRDLINGFKHTVETINFLLDRFGENDFERGLNLLTKALSKDIEAVRPSVDRTRLAAAMADIKNLFFVQSSLDSAKQILLRLEKVDEPIDASAVTIIRTLIDCTQSPAEEYTIGEFVRSHSPNAQQAARFMHGFTDLFSQLPESVWPEPKARINWFKVLQRAEDRFVIEAESAS